MRRHSRCVLRRRQAPALDPTGVPDPGTWWYVWLSPVGRDDINATLPMTTVERLKNLIHEKFGVALELIDPDAPFSSYELDSLTVAELMFEIDDAFHVAVPDEAATTVSTLRQLAELIDGLSAAPKKQP